MESSKAIGRCFFLSFFSAHIVFECVWWTKMAGARLGEKIAGLFNRILANVEQILLWSRLKKCAVNSVYTCVGITIKQITKSI